MPMNFHSDTLSADEERRLSEPPDPDADANAQEVLQAVLLDRGPLFVAQELDRTCQRLYGPEHLSHDYLRLLIRVLRGPRP